MSLFLFLQDLLDKACAEGISDEHYRLEGRTPPPLSSSNVLMRWMYGTPPPVPLSPFTYLLLSSPFLSPGPPLPLCALQSTSIYSVLPLCGVILD